MSATVTSTVTSIGHTRSKSEVRHRVRRRISFSNSSPPARQLCGSLPHSLEALDLSSANPTHTLASLRFLVLSYLAHLECRLSRFESPDIDSWLIKSELKVDDAVQWARTALDMLEGIRTDVCSHLPDVYVADISAVEIFVKSHLPDLPDLFWLAEMRSHLPDMPHLPDMDDMRAHLPEMPQLPDIPDVRSHLSDMRHRLDDVRMRLQDFDFHKPFGYIPTLSTRLQSLHSHLASTKLPSGLSTPFLAPGAMLSDLLEAVLSSEHVADIINTAPDVIEEAEDLFQRAAQEVTNAVKRSLEGVRLIKYSDLPQPWRNNPFVTQGYRFIPIERWPLLIMSLFAFHNETLNIHTHLIPFLLWGLNLLSFSNNSHGLDNPEVLFMCFALLCLFSSAVWHTMSGCAHHASMDFCARVDYIGIGWLISASVGTVVYYGFQCHPSIGRAFLGLCLMSGIAGNVFPFMTWFNQQEYRFYRIGFFLALAFTGIGPLFTLSWIHSVKETWQFIVPIIPSLLSYVIGLVFYAAHIPERFLSDDVRQKLDAIGCGSHAIWHCFIVLAVSQHRAGIQPMRDGLQCAAAGYW